MPVESLADVTRFIERVRDKVIRRVQGLPAESRNWRPGPDKWSALEHLEHVALAERWLIDPLRKMVEEAEQTGLQAPPDKDRKVDATPVLYASGAVGTRKKAPPELLPLGRELAELEAMLASSRTELLELAGRLGPLDTDRMTARVPVANVTLTAVQLVHFVGIHEWLHLQHIEGVASALESGEPPSP